MKFSSKGLALLKRAEGLRTHTYLDVNGLPTIGYGHRLTAGESYPGGIGDGQATVLLLADLRTAERAVARLVKVPLTQGQYDALVDFVFNLGQGQLAASTLLKDLNAGQYDAAAAQLLRWDHAGDQENAGLKARRLAEFYLWAGVEAQSSAA